MRSGLMVMLLSLFGAAVWAADPMEAVLIPMAGRAGLDAEAWKTAEVDGRPCAVLQAGKQGVIPVTCWWGDTLRPPEGRAFRILLAFKDTAAAPISVSAFAGLPKHYELHRVGGLADNAWKTVQIPLPWDMVMRIPGTTNTEIVIGSSGADLPVERIEIVTGDPDADEARWCRETREWTARVQAAGRETAKLPVAQNPALDNARAEAMLVPFVRAYTRLIYPNAAPQSGEAGAVLAFRLARNEIEPGQFGVYAPQADLRNVTAVLADAGLTAADGSRLAGTVILRTAEYAVTSAGIFPQRLWPAYPVDIPRGSSRMFWVTVETDENTSVPGTYRGEIMISGDNVPAVPLPVNVEVLPIRLMTMTEAGLHLGGCVTNLVPAHELDYMVKNNHNSINLWYYGFAPGIKRRSSRDFDLDFTIQDDFMQSAAKAGIQNFVYFLGGDPYGFPDTQQVERELYRTAYCDGKDQMGDRIKHLQEVCKAPDRVHPKVRPLYVKWVKKFMEHAAASGWPEPLLTPFDEPAKWTQDQNWANLYYFKTREGRDSVQRVREKEEKGFLDDLKKQGIKPVLIGKGGAGAWIKPYFKDACAAIHEGWPKARIYASIHHNHPGKGARDNEGICFLDDIEVYCTNAIHEDNKVGDKVRAGGPTKTFWQYSGCNDAKDPAEARYTFGFYFAAFDSRGSLVWAYNWGKRFDTSSGDNWLYAWTTPYSVVPAPYYEGLREAWDDRRYIETLRAVAAQKKCTKEAEVLLNALFDRAARTRTEGGRDTVNDFWARTDDPDALDAMRSQVAAMILEMNGN